MYSSELEIRTKVVVVGQPGIWDEEIWSGSGLGTWDLGLGTWDLGTDP